MHYTMTIAGVERDLPICKVTDDLYIGAFVIFGDVELTVATAAALLEKARATAKRCHSLLFVNAGYDSGKGVRNTTYAIDRDGEIVGNCEINFHGSIKTSHRAVVAISIRQKYWGVGIGSAMFSELINEARKRSIEFMELEFVEGNERGKALYEKFGFEVVSVKPRVCKLKDGTYQNLVYMQKYL